MQTPKVKSGSARCRAAVWFAIACIAHATIGKAATLNAIQTLAQNGTFPVNGLAGDAFGQVVTFNKDYLFVASPGSQPNNRSIAGAVFVYRWNGSEYEQTQVLATGGTGDHLGILQITSDRDWLVLGVTGTPLGPQSSDAIADQDFRGAALVYRLNASGQWQLAQTIDRSTLGLQDLSAIGGGGIPVLLTPQGANLGLRSAIDAERGWLFVSALYQDAIDAQNGVTINAGKVYAFRLDRASSTWTLVQTLTNPDGAFVNDAFGASVAVKGRYVMIGNGSVFQGPHVGNTSVYVYRTDGSTWTCVQRLAGNQTTTTSLLFPQFDPKPINVGDAFGNAIALDQDDAVISAPLENAYHGAAYFFHREQVQGGERWVLKQRVESDDANALTFGVFSLALASSVAVLGDIGRTGDSGPYQGAAHVYKRSASGTWQKSVTVVDPQGTPSAAFGSGVALGPNGQIAIGSSPFLGFFIPVIFRPPPAAAPPVAPGKVIVYQTTGE
jgi:hypothetical protein